MIGFVFNSPTKPAFKTLASQVVQEMDVFKELQLYLETKGYNSALPIGSDAESLDDITNLNILNFPGDKDTQKQIEEGLLWKSKNGYIGECCLSYFLSKFAKLANLLGITTDEDNERAVYDKLRIRSAFWDVCPVTASNKCGGIHNNATIQDFVTQIFLAFVKRCRNLTHINAYGVLPAKYVRETLQPMLELNCKNNITFSFDRHPQYFMQGGATLVDAQNFFKTGLVNLGVALNMDRQTVAHYQARIESDPNLVTTVVKTITPAELEKLQEWAIKYGQINGQTQFESKRGIFAEGGAGTRSLFTPNDDKLLVMYYYMFSLHDEGKWDKIASYFKKFDGLQCYTRMITLLQKYHQPRNPSPLQKQLQEQEPPVTRCSFRYIRLWNLEVKSSSQ